MQVDIGKINSFTCPTRLYIHWVQELVLCILIRHLLVVCNSYPMLFKTKTNKNTVGAILTLSTFFIIFWVFRRIQSCELKCSGHRDGLRSSQTLLSLFGETTIFSEPTSTLRGNVQSILMTSAIFEELIKKTLLLSRVGWWKSDKTWAAKIA